MKIIDALCFVGNGRYKKQTEEALLKALEQTDTACAAIAPVEEYTVVNNAEGNRSTLSLCRKHGWYGYAVANPWYGDKAAELLRDALEEGLNGVYFDSSIQGFTINDEIVNPLIEVCAGYHVPVYFHTGTPAFALPLQLRCLALRYPEVNFIMGHMGANDFISDVAPSMYRLENLYLETSMNLTCTLQDMLEKYPQRVIFGSASPRSPLEYELFKLREAADGKDRVLEQACAGNFERILGGQK